jgi:hypothetical protein
MFTRAIFSALLTVALAACGNSTSGTVNTAYPAEVRNNFLASCTAAGSSQSTCECILTGLESNISLNDFVALELGGNEAIAADSRVIEAITQCISN